MNSPTLVRTLFDYNDWCLTRLLDTAAPLDPAALAAPTPMPHGSFWDTLFHALAAEWLWIERCRGFSPRALLQSPPEKTLAALDDLRARQRAVSLAFIDTLDEPALSRAVRYTNTRGDPFELRMGHILIHAATHHVRHNAEAAQILTDLGRSPGDLDLDDYVYSTAQ